MSFLEDLVLDKECVNNVVNQHNTLCNINSQILNHSITHSQIYNLSTNIEDICSSISNNFESCISYNRELFFFLIIVMPFISISLNTYFYMKNRNRGIYD